MLARFLARRCLSPIPTTVLSFATITASVARVRTTLRSPGSDPTAVRARGGPSIAVSAPKVGGPWLSRGSIQTVVAGGRGGSSAKLRWATNTRALGLTRSAIRGRPAPGLIENQTALLLALRSVHLCVAGLTRSERMIRMTALPSGFLEPSALARLAMNVAPCALK